MGGAKAFVVRALSGAYGCVDRRSRLNVVSLHRIGPQPGALDPCTVRRQLAWLKQRHRIVLPGQLPQFAGYDGPLAIVTVDDGHACTYEQLFPICRDLDIPFVAYLPVDYLFNEHWLWFDLLEYLHRQSGQLTTGQYLSWQRQLKRQTPAQRDETLTVLARRLACELPSKPVPDYAPLRHDDVREMLRSGLFEIGSHAVTHTILTVLDDDARATELRTARATFESFFQTAVSSFCYPNGLSGDFDRRTVEQVRESGYTTAMTSLEGSNLRERMDPLCLRRIHIGLPDHALQKELCGLGAWQKTIAGDIEHGEGVV